MRNFPFVKSLTLFVALFITSSITAQYICYTDNDSDGYGTGPAINSPVLCHLGMNLSTFDGDCDDTNPNVNPGSAEYCDGIDNDCDMIVDGSPGLGVPIVLNSQTDVDNFWLMGCSGITGDLVIQTTNPSDPITSLGPLGLIFEIQGGLTIKDNALLPESALWSLGQSGGSLGGDLIIENNDLFTSLDNIDIYSPIGGDLIIKGNVGLTNTYSFGPSSIGGDLIIEDNDVLPSVNLNGLSSLTGSLIVKDNNMLNTIFSSPSFTSIGGDLIVDNNPIFISLEPLQFVTSISGQLTITNNPLLEFCHISGVCGNLVAPGTMPTIFGNAYECEGVQMVECHCGDTVWDGDLIFNSQSEITYFCNTTQTVNGDLVYESTDPTDPIVFINSLGIETVNGDMIVQNNNASGSALYNLQTINGNLYWKSSTGYDIDFDALYEVNDIYIEDPVTDEILMLNLFFVNDIEIINCNNVEYLDINFLETVNDLSIKDCPKLEKFEIGSLETANNILLDNTKYNLFEDLFESLLTVNQSLIFRNNSEMEKLRASSLAIPLLTSVHNLIIENNPLLDEINTFNSLTQVGNDLILNGNDLGTDISGFSNLVSIGNDFQALFNTELSTLNDFSSLSSVTGEIRVEANPQLDYCHIQAVCDHIANSGTTIISGNNTNCANVATVTARCDGDCPVGDLIFNSQEEVNAFLGCKNVFGDLIIETDGSGTDITDLSPLSPLETVTGNIEIVNNPSLVSMNNVLPNLTDANGHLLMNNPQLTHFSGLNLSGPALFLGIEDCPMLNNLNVYSNLTNFGNLVIRNTGLTSLADLTSLDNVGDFTIESNTSLANLIGLQNLTRVDVHFEIENNPLLTDVSALSKLGNCGYLEIKNCDALTTVAPIGTSSSTGNTYGSFGVIDNDALSDIKGFSFFNIPITGVVRIKDNPMLSYCHLANVCDHIPVGNITEISGNNTNCADVATVEVFCNGDCPVGDLIFNSQEEINAFIDCKNVVGDVFIEDDGSGTAITDLSPLFTLEDIQGKLVIKNNPSLLTISGFSNLIHLETLWVIDNPNVSSVSGFSNLINMIYITLLNNPSLASVTCLSNLETVSGIELIDNPLLTDLSGWGSLKSITGTPGIFMIENNGLSDLSALGSLEHVNGDFQILKNPNLINLNDLNSFLSMGADAALIIRDNPMLQTIGGFNAFNSSITSLGSSLFILENSNLISVSGFTALKELRSLSFNLNPNLATISGFSILEECNSFNISSSPVLNGSGGFSQLTKVHDIFSIALSGIQDLVDFGNLIEIGIRFDLTGNLMLVDIQTLDLTLLPDEINIWGNSLLDICHISSVCDVIQNDPSLVNIHSNNTNCIDIPTVQLKCEDAMPVVDGTTDACITVATINISGSNNNQWIQVSNGGNILCSINANGNDLGSTEFKVFQWSNPNPRIAGLPYMNRDVTISPATQPGSAVSVRLYYTAAEFAALQAADPTIGSIADVDFTKIGTDCSGMFTGTGLFVPQTGSGTYGSSGDVYVQGDVTSFSTFFANGQDQALGGVVPVELLSFSAKAKGSTTELSWVTASEINSSHFEIQHATTLDDLARLSEVQAQGYAENEHSYSYTHKYPQSGNNYYKLKLIDMDGSFSYSETINIRMEENELTIYPNPVRDKIYVNGVDDAVDFTIYDQTGRIMSRGRVEDAEPIDMQDLVKGIYQLVIKQPGAIKNFSIVKL